MSISDPTDNYTSVNNLNETQSFSHFSETLENILYTRASYWNSFHATEYVNPNIIYKNGDKLFKNNSTLITWMTQSNNEGFLTKNNTAFGNNSYRPNQTKIKEARKIYWDALVGSNDLASNIGQARAERFEYHLGWYSPIFLSRHRSNMNFARAYQDVTYNPNCDKKVKNRLWVQPLTKPTTEFDEKRCKCVVQDLPLWSALYCYQDFVEEELGTSSEILNSCLLVVQCPYTFPPMYDKKLPNKGYVWYDSLFGDGKMSDGRGQVDIFWQQRWYPRLATQIQVMHDITKTGPFSYRDDLVSTQLTAKYTFDFIWGGNMISTQIIKNPCKDSGLEPAYPGRLPRDLQIVDPYSMGPQFSFHNWDYRHGLFGQDAIDRVSKQPKDAADYPNPYKRPRYFPPTDQAVQGQEKDFNFLQTRASSSEESDQEVLQEAQVLQFQPEQHKQLHLQLAEQQRLGEQLRFLLHQMFKTQANLHLNPYTYTQL